MLWFEDGADFDSKVSEYLAFHIPSPWKGGFVWWVIHGLGFGLWAKHFGEVGIKIFEAL